MFNSYLYNNNSSSVSRYGKSMDTKRIVETQKFGPSKSYINESEDSSSKINVNRSNHLRNEHKRCNKKKINKEKRDSKNALKR